MVHPHHLDLTPARDPAGDLVLHVLEDRLAFSRAQAILTGLTGCTQLSAARSLRRTATELDRSAASLAHLFLHSLDHREDEDSASLLLLLAVQAFEAAGPAPPPDGSPVSGGSRAGTPGEGPAQAGRLRVVPIGGGLRVSGDLDRETAPLLAPYGTPATGGVPTPGRDYLLDLSGLAGIDLRGVRALDGLVGRLVGVCADLAVTPPGWSVPRRALDFAVRMGWLRPVRLADRSESSGSPGHDRP